MRAKSIGIEESFTVRSKEEQIAKARMLNEIYNDNRKILDARTRRNLKVEKKEIYPIRFFKQCIKMFFN